MRTAYLTAIMLPAFVAGAGLAVYSMRSQSDFCPQPRAASVTAFYAPCQAFYGATGDVILNPETMRTAVLTEQLDRPATLLAARLAESVDPFRSGG
jgi:hypothetical protein